AERHAQVDSGRFRLTCSTNSHAGPGARRTRHAPSSCSRQTPARLDADAQDPTAQPPPMENFFLLQGTYRGGTLGALGRWRRRMILSHPSTTITESNDDTVGIDSACEETLR